MCGICGILHAERVHHVEPETVRRMTDAIIHRGPDDDGFFFEGGVGMGMRRLAIIDLEGGTQPITNEDSTVHLVYDGEIYTIGSCVVSWRMPAIFLRPAPTQRW